MRILGGIWSRQFPIRCQLQAWTGRVPRLQAGWHGAIDLEGAEEHPSHTERARPAIAGRLKRVAGAGMEAMARRLSRHYPVERARYPMVANHVAECRQMYVFVQGWGRVELKLRVGEAQAVAARLWEEAAGDCN